MPTRRLRKVPVGYLRFAHGLRILTAPPQEAPTARAAVRVDIVRPEDLVALSVEALGCELVKDDGSVFIRPIPGEADPLLVVIHGPQHIGEEATYDDNGALVVPPVRANAARPSRIVFKLRQDESIAFTTEAILAAMSRLEMSVHELATPGEAPGPGRGAPPLLIIPLEIPLGDRLVGRIEGERVTVGVGPTVRLKTLRRRSGRGLAGIAEEARSLRLARQLLRDRVVMEDHGPPAGLAATSVNIAGRNRDIGPVWRRRQPWIPLPWIPQPTLSHAPTATQTAIEAPFRLVISPSEQGRWAHSPTPVKGQGGHVELWHSRLAQALKGENGSEEVDERNAAHRIVRAIWARDRDFLDQAEWGNPQSGVPGYGNDPFLTSLAPAERHILVRQSSETIVGAGLDMIPPVPVGARALWLSGLGAWLDLHGAWATRPYSAAGIDPIFSWDHIAPMGRDQDVQVLSPGYLYPFGHQACLVKVTNRKMKSVNPSVAGLYQRNFIAIGEPRKTYADAHNFPFTEVSIRPLVTPGLDDLTTDVGNSQTTYFWPKRNQQPYSFVVDALDHEGKLVRLNMPMMWVAEQFTDFAAVNKAYEISPLRNVDAFGQQVAFAPSHAGGDTTLEARNFWFMGAAGFGTSTPRMTCAEVVHPAVQKITPMSGPFPIVYHKQYRTAGFEGGANSGEMWAQVLFDSDTRESDHDPAPIQVPMVSFGKPGSGAERGGGFLAPNVPIRGLSRLAGVVGDPAGMASQKFDPKPYFSGSMPKLFGIISLDDLALSVDSDLLRIPKMISELLSRVEALISDIGRAGAALGDAIEEAGRMAARAADNADLVAQAQQAIDAANAAQDTFDQMAARLPALIDLIKTKGKADLAVQNLKQLLVSEVNDTCAQFDQLGDRLPPYMGAVMHSVSNLLRTTILGTADLVEDIARFIQGLPESGSIARVRFEWKPRVANWPAAPNDPLIVVKDDSLVFAIEAQTGMDGKPKSQVLAELRDFQLRLFPTATLLALSFDHFSFKAAGSGKPEIDIVMHDIEFLGVLSFIEGIKNLIPLDGFSDPPSVDVTAEGLTAAFTLSLPDIALGMFSITNLSLGADVRVPFLGEAMTVGFGFCSRERPFTIAVAFIGGGGWVCTRLSANGLEVLEVGLEAGACIAVNLVVASGSVQAMIGVYIRLESQAGSISGYFRLRGQVDVLGLISAAIELYMALVYDTFSGKLIGEASITVNVKVICFSKSVSIHARRVFAGSNGDPSFADIMGVVGDASPAWTEYCLAFAEE